MRIFLSYSHDNQETADQFREGLARCGFEVWSDQVLEPGADLIQKVSSAISTADSAVFLFGKTSSQTSWTSLEAAMATAAGKRVIPVLTDQDADVPILLRGLVHMDASDPAKREDQIGLLCELLSQPAEPRSVASGIDAVRRADEALRWERSAYELSRERKSVSLARTEVVMATVSAIAAIVALIAASGSDASVIAAIAAGVISALIAGAFIYTADVNHRSES